MRGSLSIRRRTQKKVNSTRYSEGNQPGVGRTELFSGEENVTDRKAAAKRKSVGTLVTRPRKKKLATALKSLDVCEMGPQEEGY